MDSPRSQAGLAPDGADQRRRTAAAWVVLATAGLLEIVWATALKESDGFSRLWPSVLAVVTAFVSFIMLSLALRNLPVGTAYAVWVGIGAVGTAALGMLVMGDQVSATKIIALAFIVIGVVGLNLAGGAH